MLVTAAGLLMLTRFGSDSSYAGDVLPALQVFGLGVGPSLPPAVDLGTAGTTGDDAGTASALVNAAQQVGGAIGIAVLSTVATTTAATAASGGSGPAATLAGYSAAYLWSAVILAAGAVGVGRALISPRPVGPRSRRARRAWRWWRAPLSFWRRPWPSHWKRALPRADGRLRNVGVHVAPKRGHRQLPEPYDRADLGVITDRAVRRGRRTPGWRTSGLQRDDVGSCGGQERADRRHACGTVLTLDQQAAAVGNLPTCLP